MAFDGFTTKKVILELKKVLIGSKVNKVYQPNKQEIVLGLYNDGVNYLLNISTNPEFCRINLTKHQKPNPQTALNFCMLLRKYLTGAKIVDISNYDLERTIEIKFEAYNELNDLVLRRIYIEIMSRQSNIILANENNMIIDTLRHMDNTRDLLPAHEYTFTPINKKSFIDISFDEFLNLKSEYTETNLMSAFFINTFIGFSKPFLSEVLTKLNISNTDYNEKDLELVFNYIKNIINQLDTEKVFCKKLNDKEYTIIYDESFENKDDNDPDNMITVNSFLDEFYYEKETTTFFTNSRNSLLKIVSAYLKKVSKKLDNINAKLKECENMDQYRLNGELLTANLYRFDNTANLQEVVVNNYYDENKEITIKLDPSISVQKNVEKFYKKYNKLKNTLEIVTKQKSDAIKELDYIESIVFNLSNAKNLNDINEIYEEIAENVSTKRVISKQKINIQRQKKQKLTAQIKLEAVIIDGFTVLIGKNNIQNDYLTLKLSRANDVWFHAQKLHGSHVLLRNPDGLDLDEIPENVLFNCAKLAKENSKGATSLNVPVDYCFVRNVKKAQGAKPGMVNYTNFRTIIVK